LSNSAFCLHAGRPASIRLMRSRHHVIICTFGHVRYAKFDVCTVKRVPHNTKRLPPVAFSQLYRVHQNSVSAGAPPRTTLGELTTLRRPARGGGKRRGWRLSNSAFLFPCRPASIRLMRSRHHVVICTFGVWSC